MYALGIFLGAFLLFHVQPMIAKHILPWYGSTPAVWTTCMVFFQALLVAGYTYAHGLPRCAKPSRQTAVHGVLIVAVAAIFLFQWNRWGAPMLPGEAWKDYPPDEPRRWLLLMLLAGVGLPYFVLSTTNPLLQKWFTRAQPGQSPYGLYVLSNLGSLAGLLAYPFLVERILPLRAQAIMVAALFVIYGIICLACAIRASRSDAELPPQTIAAFSPPADSSPRILWLLLSFCGSVMLLAVTNQLCQEVAVVPLLWVLPLSLYLISFMIGFSSGPFYSRKFFLAVFIASSFATCIAAGATYIPSLVSQIVIYSLLLFSACTLCHGELARLKPSPEKLTSFYLIISIGGALGGIFVSLIAPVIFVGFFEFHLGLVLCWLLLLAVLLRDHGSALHRGSPAAAHAFTICAILLLAWLFQPAIIKDVRTAGAFKTICYYSVATLLAVLVASRIRQIPETSRFHIARPGWPRAGMAVAFMLVVATLAQVLRDYDRYAIATGRNFFGTLRIRKMPFNRKTDPEFKILVNGNILHGMQAVDPASARITSSYYTENSGVALAILNHPRRETSGLRIGAVGLGAGTIAAYTRTNDTIRFYEINPAVAGICSGPKPVFTYVVDSYGPATIKLGDGRLLLERELAASGPAAFDVLVLDAFSSDAIPAHLLTREAFDLYLRHLARPDGIIAVNIANRFINLMPVLRAHARHHNLDMIYIPGSADDERALATRWVLLSPDRTVFKAEVFTRADDKRPLAGREVLWTDDFSNIFQLIL